MNDSNWTDLARAFAGIDTAIEGDYEELDELDVSELVED